MDNFTRNAIDNAKRVDMLLEEILGNYEGYAQKHGIEKTVIDAIKKVRLLNEMDSILAEYTAKHKILYVGTLAEEERDTHGK